jgi:sugar lactone lactonase YvrE
MDQQTYNPSIRKNLSVTASALFVMAAGFSSASMAGTITYTNDSDFSQGNLNSVNYNAPNNNQLQINVSGDTFPVLWVPNTSENSMSRINTDGDAGRGCEEARYFTSNSSRGYPSRTAVDVDGNIYVANRKFDGQTPELLKIVTEGGIDRNGNGVIDTSTDLNGDCRITPDEMLPIVDDGDGVLDIDDFTDERVVWISQFGQPGQLGRSLCLDNNGFLWAGTYYGRQYYKFDTDGNIVAGPVDTFATNYGCAVDNNGILWGASLGSTMVELDTNTDTWTQNRALSSNYGIAIGNNRVYLGSTLQSFNPATEANQVVASGGTGVAVDGDGFVWFGTPTLRKFATDTNGDLNPTPVCSVSTQGVRGPIIGKGNRIWTINYSNNSVSQYDSDCNFISTVPVGRNPYTYSDATGFIARNFTDPTGIWSVVNDSGDTETEWDGVTWNTEPEGNVPAGASIEVRVRVANSVADLPFATFQPVVNGVNGMGLVGQFIEVRTIMRPNSTEESPILSDLNLLTIDEVLRCDLDESGEVNINDIRLYSTHRNTPVAPDHPMDIDGNGVLNINDGRKCALQCANPSCAVSAL